MRRVVIANLSCKCCGNVFQMPRERSRRPKRGNIQHVWCYECEKPTPHTELVDTHNEVVFTA